MNNRNIAITTGVVASFIGLGFLSYFLFSKKETAIEKSNEQIDPPIPISLPEKRIETVVIRKARNEEVVQQEKMKQLEFVETAIDISTTTTKKLGIADSVSPSKNEIISDEFPLQLGSKGKRIERLQVWLLRNYGYSGKITAAFDEKTLKLVQKHLKTVRIDEELYNKLEMDKRVYEQLKA